MLQRLSEKGFTLRFQKCLWDRAQVLYFGYIFSEEGMGADPEKIKAITELESPKNISEVQSFLQMFQYNAYFIGETGIETYSDMTSPLRMLLKKNAQFHWTNKQEEAFVKLKKQLVSEKVMAPYSPDRRTQLVVDRGSDGIAATVMQMDPDVNEWRPVNYVSRSLSCTEKNYSPIEGESLAIYSGTIRNKMYLYGIQFEVITDHQPLVPLYNKPRNNGPVRVERHRVKLQGFDFHVKYEPGKSNPCDYNSRHPLALPVYCEENMEEFGIEEGTEIYINAVIADDLPDAVTYHILKRETNHDDALAMLKADIISGKLSERPEIQKFKSVLIESNLDSR